MRVAAVQLNCTADQAANMTAADRHTRAAAAAGAKLVVLPEKWTVIGTAEDLKAGAQTLEGPAISWAREAARELKIHLIAGSVAERVEGQQKLSNTSVHVDPDGQLRSVYRKIHMFDVQIDGQRYQESDHEQPGDEIRISDGPNQTKLGMSICYDLRFPEIYRIMAIGGAQVMVLPAAFTLPTTRDHWEVLLRARAIENQCFMIAANQIGAHPGNMRSGGRSMIVDPWGIVLAQASDCEQAILADLDLDRQREIRVSLPALSNRRAQSYRWPSEASL